MTDLFYFIIIIVYRDTIISIILKKFSNAHPQIRPSALSTWPYMAAIPITGSETAPREYLYPQNSLNNSGITCVRPLNALRALEYIPPLDYKLACPSRMASYRDSDPLFTGADYGRRDKGRSAVGAVSFEQLSEHYRDKSRAYAGSTLNKATGS